MAGTPVSIRDFKDRTARAIESGMHAVFDNMEIILEGEISDNHRKIKDSTGTVGFPWNNDRFRAVADGTKVRASGYPQITVSKNSAVFVNFDVTGFEVLDDSFRDPKEVIAECMRTSNSFNSRPFPQDPKSVAIIYPRGDSSPVLRDMLGECDFSGLEIHRFPTEITNSAAVAASISSSEASACDILVIIQGGMDVDTFSHPDVLKALNSTPEKQYRLLAIGHSTCLPAAYFFSDGKAQTPSSAGSLLKALLRGAAERERKIMEKAKTTEATLRKEIEKGKQVLAEAGAENEKLRKSCQDKDARLETTGDMIHHKWMLSFISIIGGMFAGYILALIIAK